MGLEVGQGFLSADILFLQSQQGFSNSKVHFIEGRRASYAAIEVPPTKKPADVTFEIIHIPNGEGFKLPIHHSKRADVATEKAPSAAVIHAHGGGLIAFRPEINIQRLSDIVSETGVQAFSVDYRLAPEYPYPTALNDC